MRVLAIVHHFPPDVNSTGLLMGRLFEELAQQGHDVSVITTFPHYEEFRTWPEYRRRLFKRDNHKGLQVTRVYSYTSGTKTMKRRLLNYLSFNLFALVAGLFSRQKFDLVFCTNGSFFSGITGYLVSRLKRARCIYNLQDLYPEVPVAQRQLKSPRAIKALERIERFMYRKADQLTVITPSFLDNLRSKSVDMGKVSVIPNFVDTEFIRPLAKTNEFSIEHDLTDRFVVSHAGNIGYVYDLGSLLVAADKLQDNSEIHFLIVGDGVAKAELQAQATRLQLRNVTFLPFQPFEALPLLRGASDVHVSLYKKGAGRYSMPSKIYEIMASGRPVLASAEQDSDIREFVDRVGCGVCIDPGEPDQLVDALVKLYSDPAQREAMGDRGRQEAVRSYSLVAAAIKYGELFERIRIR